MAVIIVSADVIHSIGYCSLGVKIDAIPARINTSQTIRPVIIDSHNGFRFELCGQGHTSMIGVVEANTNIDYSIILSLDGILLFYFCH